MSVEIPTSSRGALEPAKALKFKFDCDRIGGSNDESTPTHKSSNIRERCDWRGGGHGGSLHPVRPPDDGSSGPIRDRRWSDRHPEPALGARPAEQYGGGAARFLHATADQRHRRARAPQLHVSCGRRVGAPVCERRPRQALVDQERRYGSIVSRSGGDPGDGPHLGRAAWSAQLRIPSQFREAGQAGLSTLLHGQHRNRRQPAQRCEGALRDLSGAARQRRLRMAGRRRDLVGRGAQLPPGGAPHHPARARPLPGPDRLQSRCESRLQRVRPAVYRRG